MWKLEVEHIFCIIHNTPANTSSHFIAPDIPDFEDTLLEYLHTFDSSISHLSAQHIAGLCKYISIWASQQDRLNQLASRHGFQPMNVDPAPPPPCAPQPKSAVSYADWACIAPHQAACNQVNAIGARVGIKFDLPPITTLPPSSPASSVSSIHGWETVEKSKKKKPHGSAKPSSGQTGSAPTKAQPSSPAALSFAAVAAAAPAKSVAPLTWVTLNKMMHLQTVNAFNAHFSGTFTTTDITKDGVISAYLSRVEPVPRPCGQPGKIPLHTSEWTIVCGASLPDAQGPHEDPVKLVRCICQDIAGVSAPNSTPELQLLGGWWSSQVSLNFVLIFAGQPDSKVVMKYCNHLLRPFRAGCQLAPQKGYTRVMINGVCTMQAHDGFDGALPSHLLLKEELTTNAMWQGIQLLGDICWVNLVVALLKSHLSIMVSFLDINGSLLKSIVRQPPYLFGEHTTAKAYVVMPLLCTCSRCHSLRHNVEQCAHKSTVVICIYCGGRHRSEDHAVCCIHKAKHDIAGVCNCAPSCLNCRYEQKPCASHYANDLNCLLCKKFRTPTCHTGDTTDKEKEVLQCMLSQ